MGAILIDGSMFEDKSDINCFNFWISDQDGTYQVGAKFIIELGLTERILKRIQEGYLDVRRMGLVYGGVQILEVQWG